MTKRTITSLMQQIDQRATAGTMKRADPKAKPEMRSTLLSFLEVLDSLERLIGQPTEPVPSTTDLADWRSHVQVLHQQMLAVFEKCGVAFEDPLAKRFDPVNHEAVEIVSTNEIPPYTITRVFSRGCKWRGQVLRYAKVAVAFPPEIISE